MTAGRTTAVIVDLTGYNVFYCATVIDFDNEIREKCYLDFIKGTLYRSLK